MLVTRGGYQLYNERQIMRCTKIFGLSVSLLLPAFLLGACGGDTSVVTPGQEVKSDKQRLTEPPDNDVPELVGGNTQFAVDVYKKLAADAENENIFFSPYSISVALAMTWAGARGDTESQMADTLHFSLDQTSLHPAFDWLDLALNSRGQGAMGQDGEPFRLHVVNRLFGQTGYQFLEPFLDTLALYYGAGLYLLDFASNPEAGRLVINDWVAEQTEDRIKDLIPPPAITVNTKLVLVNAIYFNAKWKEVFNDQLTADGSFTLLDGGSVTVPLMVHENPLPYGAGSGWQAVEIPYDGEELSMVVIVPDDFGAFEESLDAGKIADILSSLGSDSATLTMPRFSVVGATFSVKKILTELGMSDAFVMGQADLSGMDGTRYLYISDVLHQAFVAVDEYGTEAAAATAVVVNDFGVPNHLDVDRPFVFVIRDIQTDSVLFIGRVLDPSA